MKVVIQRTFGALVLLYIPVLIIAFLFGWLAAFVLLTVIILFQYASLYSEAEKRS